MMLAFGTHCPQLLTTNLKIKVSVLQWRRLCTQDINPRGYSKWPLERFVRAAHEGDLELLTKMSLSRRNNVRRWILLENPLGCALK